MVVETPSQGLSHRRQGLSRRVFTLIAVADVGALLFLPLKGVGLVGSVASLLALVAFASVHAALMRLRVTGSQVERLFRVPLVPGCVFLVAVLGLLIVVLLLTPFKVRVYGIAAAALAITFLGRAMPWR